MARTTEASDFISDELNGVIDYASLPVGGVTVEAVQMTGREFKADGEGKIAYEKFMAEPIIIKIHATANQNEAPVAEVGLNGVKINIPREKPVRLPRAYVEVLARSQFRRYRQVNNPDPTAAEGTSHIRTVGQDYPFEIIEDKHPKGRAWLQRIMRESA